MDASIQQQSPEDYIRWPDGTVCYRSELWGYQHKSDDYEVIPFATTEWNYIEATES